MTLNLLFFTITIKKQIQTTEELEQQLLVEKLMEENRNREANMYRTF